MTVTRTGPAPGVSEARSVPGADPGGEYRLPNPFRLPATAILPPWRPPAGGRSGGIMSQSATQVEEPPSEPSRGDPEHLSWTHLGQRFEKAGNQRLVILKAVAASDEDDDGDVIPRHVLLVLKLPVGGQKDLEQAAGPGEKLPVAEALPAHLGDRMGSMSGKDGLRRYGSDSSSKSRIGVRQQGVFRELENLHSLFPGHGG